MSEFSLMRSDNKKGIVALIFNDFNKISCRIMSEIDLHCHTHHSDGSLAVADLIQRAVNNGVRLLAITDHDSVAAHNELSEQFQQRQSSAPLEIDVIPAVEISASWRNKDIHIVGLNIDHSQKELTEFLAAQYRLRSDRATELVKKMQQRLKISDAANKIAQLAKGGIICRSHFAQLIVNEGKAVDFKRAFEKFLKKGKIASVRSHWPEMSEVVTIIRKAGGKAVIAHPTRYRLNNSTLYELVEDFSAVGGTALEVAYPGIKPKQQRHLVRLANTFSLAGSQGSDFHHPYQVWADLGKVPYFPADIQPIWNDF
ncbi:MAG TPA: PHP domain-containing protein [Aeromonadales bacterium]|nr:PHP domain-containing protein [Aeromonadales bacterium]